MPEINGVSIKTEPFITKSACKNCFGRRWRFIDCNCRVIVNYLIQGKAAQELQQILRNERASILLATPSVPTPEPALAMATITPTVSTPFPLPDTKTAMFPEFVSFFYKNNDMSGWLKADAFYEIDFPIVKRDNCYYFNHDFYGRKNMSGTVFLDAANSIMPQDQNLILHGHNMKNGTMFGKLAHLLKRDVLESQPFFRFSTLYDAQVYVPYAVSMISIDPNDQRYMQLIVPHFNDAKLQSSYVDALRHFSAFNLPIDVEQSDRMLTLITCHGKENSERLVVGLRALRPNESEEQVRLLLSNQNSEN